jgi:hypothetical protein
MFDNIRNTVSKMTEGALKGAFESVRKELAKQSEDQKAHSGVQHPSSSIYTEQGVTLKGIHTVQINSSTVKIEKSSDDEKIKDLFHQNFDMKFRYDEGT